MQFTRILYSLNSQVIKRFRPELADKGDLKLSQMQPWTLSLKDPGLRNQQKDLEIHKKRIRQNHVKLLISDSFF